MKEREIDHGAAAFETQGRLLEELGERLVASPEVALVELIKNAYDADSSICHVRLEDRDKTLVVEDRGLGMTLDEFQNNWMRIATSSKADMRVSRKFRRPLTGAKGIGRFAVRYLGGKLRLDSVAFDAKRSLKTRLVADFAWMRLDKAFDLKRAEIPWELFEVPQDTAEGTRLIINQLRPSADFARHKQLRSEVLRIVSPVTGLDAGPFKYDWQTASGKDPGFRVLLPGDDPKGSRDVNLAETVLRNSWARLTISMAKQRVKFCVSFNGSHRSRNLTVKVDQMVSAGLHADIRFFPRRGGVFANKEVNGTEAWKWVRHNCGVAVIDHGFRIKPYGYAHDDWLRLDIDNAHNERSWRSVIANEQFPIPEEKKKDPALNPTLYLPSNYQLVGAVFVESRRGTSLGGENDLVSSMDREGFLRNGGFTQLFEVVRAGIEFLALCDKDEIDTLQAEHAKRLAAEARQDFRKAIDYFRHSSSLGAKDKARIISEYSGLAQRFQEQEAYHKRAQENLTTMSLLGVVAGFMTHESRGLVANLETLMNRLKELAKRHRELRSDVASAEKHLRNLQQHLDYTSLFIDATQAHRISRFPVAPQIRMIVRRFGTIARDHGITIDCNVSESMKAPALPISAYSGIVLNLFSNAIKAVLAAPSSLKRSLIRISAHNEGKRHVLEVADNGIGIPPELRDRIWDPLFTTTSNLNNPLGSGMGLGLSLVFRLVTDLGGKINLMDEAPKDFRTCFRVSFPINTNGNGS